MKRTLKVSLSVMLMASVLLTACGKKEETVAGSSAAPSAATGKVVKLKWWGGVPEENGPKAVVDAWNAANKDIQVEYVRFVNDDSGNTKLDTALLSTSDAPDLFVSYGDFLLDRRVKGDMVEPLEDLIKKTNFDLEGTIGSENLLKINNKIYQLPGSKDMRFFAFNKASLDAAGEKVPTADWTWSDYAALGKKLTKSGQYGTFLLPTWEPIAFDVIGSDKPNDPYYKADGTTNFDAPSFKMGLELQKGLLDAKAMMPYQEALANKSQPQDELLKGKAATVYSSLYFIRYIKDDKAYPGRDFKVAFAPTPQMEKGKNVNNAKLSDYTSINSKSTHKEEAMKFLSWYLKEGNLNMVPGGRIPSNKNVDVDKLADLIMGDKSQYFDKDSFVSMLKGKYTPTTSVNTTASTQIRQIFMEEAEKYFMNAQPIDKTVGAIKSRSDEAVKSAKK
ncbi:ABC transporter substrate-binding protein [Paenibacillus qinlingensis]|uniref:ABC transporter substrate-binding protein n=1 Tax=Paenibacillus qinlingensis TaxID=1837343 RepID=UPI00156640C1|nr:extracellular solute-binding protein [Paenibacillus qinlingensis]NQX60045.1 extracellular solute-binding protein [Paenibacillus qinlingensis]